MKLSKGESIKEKLPEAKCFAFSRTLELTHLHQKKKKSEFTVHIYLDKHSLCNNLSTNRLQLCSSKQPPLIQATTWMQNMQPRKEKF